MLVAVRQRFRGRSARADAMKLKFLATLIALAALTPFEPTQLAAFADASEARCDPEIARRPARGPVAHHHPVRRRCVASAHRGARRARRWAPRPPTARHREPGRGRAQCGVLRAARREPVRRARVARSRGRRRRWSGPAPPSARPRRARISATTAPASASRSSIPAITAWHDDLARRRRRPAGRPLRRLRRRRDDAARRLRARHARRRHHRRQRPRLGRRAHRHRAGRAPHRAQGARRERAAATSAT